MFIEAFENLLIGHCTPAEVRAIETGGSHHALWSAIVDAGFLELMAPEEHDGAGLDLAGVLPLLHALGAHAVPLPVAQAIALRTLWAPGESAPEGLPTFAPALVRQANGHLLAPRVPYGAVADCVVTEFEGHLWLLQTQAAERIGTGIPRDATADLLWPTATLSENSQVARRMACHAPTGALEAWGAALHAALLGGAMSRCFELTLQYGNDRAQFGKSIGKFQAIQHQLAVMAEHVAAARIAVAGAFTKGTQHPSRLPAAIAKARASEAVTVVASIAHAVHGAIGVTEEYDLQLLTRRMHAWRMAHGSEVHWHRVIGRALLDSSAQVGEFVRTLDIAHSS